MKYKKASYHLPYHLNEKWNGIGQALIKSTDLRLKLCTFEMKITIQFIHNQTGRKVLRHYMYIVHNISFGRVLRNNEGLCLI